MSEFRMPSLGADMEAGTVVEWRIKPGDRVKRGEVVGVIETDKGAVDLEIFETGVVDELVVPVGERVPVGAVLARLRNGVAPGPPQVVEPHHRISPLARKMAAEMHLDLTHVTGSGSGGAICRADVLRASAMPSTPAPAQTAVPAPQATAPARNIVDCERGRFQHQHSRQQAIGGQRLLGRRSVPTQRSRPPGCCDLAAHRRAGHTCYPRC